MLPPAGDAVRLSDPHPGRGHCVPNLRPRTMAIVILVPGMKPVKLFEERRLVLLLVKKSSYSSFMTRTPEGVSLK